MNQRQDGRAIVLVIEDVEWIRARMRSSLKLHGYLVLEASDDEEAVEIASRIHPDLILTEEELPTFDALALRLREHPTLRHVPVVIINPDEEEDTLYGDAHVLLDYDQIGRFLAALGRHPRL